MQEIHIQRSPRSSGASSGAAAQYDGPDLTAPLDAVLDLILPEPEAG